MQDKKNAVNENRNATLSRRKFVTATSAGIATGLLRQIRVRIKL
jgi:hypothetical protein